MAIISKTAKLIDSKTAEKIFFVAKNDKICFKSSSTQIIKPPKKKKLRNPKHYSLHQSGVNRGLLVAQWFCKLLFCTRRMMDWWAQFGKCESIMSHAARKSVARLCENKNESHQKSKHERNFLLLRVITALQHQRISHRWHFPRQFVMNTNVVTLWIIFLLQFSAFHN